MKLTKRFASPVKESTFVEAAKGIVPTNTKQCNSWALRAFECWATQCSEVVPSGLLQSNDADLIAQFMRCFVLEVRKEDGEQHTPGMIRSLLCGLNRALKENGATFSILDKGNPAFRELHLTLDTVTSGLHRQGIGATRKNAPIISREHEVLFWEKGLLGYDSPKSLQRAVFFCVGLHFVLRGVDEQHSLTLEQIVRYPVYSSDVYYEYTEYISKNSQHRFKDINSRNKHVRVFATPESAQCVVRLLDTYIGRLPESTGAFYLRPLSSAPSVGPWYAHSRMGVNTLKKVLPDLCNEACLNVHYTNHSLRATAITRMYEGGVSENIISEKSGHRSIKGLRSYEKTSVSQEKGAGATISPGYAAEQKTEDVKPSTLPSTSQPVKDDSKPSTLPTFSGLQNCTFNFYTTQ